MWQQCVDALDICRGGRRLFPGLRIPTGINPPSRAIGLTMTRNQQIRWFVKPAVFLGSVAPSTWLAWAALHGQLSANPLADLTNETGVWALRFLSLTLCVTPLRRLSGWNDAIRFRRMLGLFAFYYGSLHLL